DITAPYVMVKFVRTHRKEKLKELLNSYLTQGEEALRALMHRPSDELRYVDFEDANLSNQKLNHLFMTDMRLAGANFEGATIKGGHFARADLTESSFTNAVLNEVRMAGAVAPSATFNGARLTKIDLSKADLRKASFCKANLKDVDFTKANLKGTDFSGAKNINQCTFQDAQYTESTVFPDDFSLASQLKWKGKGPDPYKESLRKTVYFSGDVDFDGFMAILHEHFDNARVENALKMLKKEKFQLYSETNDSHVAGIVKSQRDTELLYACELTSKGGFTCCTQNLRPCGGLRGAPCKHLLVLVIGLAKAELVTPTKAAEWVLASKAESPKVNADTMAEIFLRYGKVEAGEIDWRPTETTPEDYYSF
ncbi:MAG: pentapeptide repeat-containing protein, partial [Cyanobacteria bacterium]|nr:pentapeptide repeat-containing protein [Cyanobacteriota bacterium]